MAGGGFGQGLLLTDLTAVTPTPLPQSSITLLRSAPLLPWLHLGILLAEPRQSSTTEFCPPNLDVATQLLGGSSNAVGLLEDLDRRSHVCDAVSLHVVVLA